MTKKETKPEKKNANGRYENKYRYSDKLIETMTKWLVALVIIGPVLGFIISASASVVYGDFNDIPAWVNGIAIAFAIGGIALPLTVGAWFGATALNKYAGPVGLLLVFGIGAFTVGKVDDAQSMWLWIGLGSMILAGALFFYIGFQAKVPMWLQLPILQSPRLYVANKPASKKKKSPPKK